MDADALVAIDVHAHVLASLTSRGFPAGSPEAAVAEVFGSDALLNVPELAAFYRERKMAANVWPGELEFDPVAFDHPLYVLFSSGTTGLPKAIVHGHGGILIEHVKNLGLGWDLKPGGRMLWYSTTAWMMWNALVSGLLLRSSIVLIDGDPAWPDLAFQWRVWR